MTSKTHAGSTNLASAVGAAHEVVNDNGGILVIGTQLFFDLVKVSLIYNDQQDLKSARCLQQHINLIDHITLLWYLFQEHRKPEGFPGARTRGRTRCKQQCTLGWRFV